ncbi:MAG TPA: O-antigen ligase family protein [Acidimicrobiales bacterium]|nr:O-antigen ligase family protein [Acidimicrobiales bacterium]
MALGVCLAYVGAHLALGIGGHLVPVVATAHAGLVALGLGWLAVWGRRIDRLILLTAYGALCDAYWRMTHSRAPWEFSKYLLLFGAVALLARYCRGWQRPAAPIAFVLLLLPGIAMLVVSQGFAASREIISSDEMGLISLGVAALAFRQIVATEAESWNLCWVMLGPVATTLAITTWASLTTSDLGFTSESNFAVTGGFGPNQISVMLGLGILLCLLLAFQRRGTQYLVVLGGLGLWMTWGAFLTFSRGGIYSLVVAGGVLVVVGVGTSGARLRSVTMAVVGIVGLLVAYSSVNDFSGNWLETRYGESSSSATGRTNLAKEDLDVWADHPLLGVGTGQSPQYHSLGGRSGVAAHTEYTRMLAEHGLLGLLAVGLLGSMFVSGIRRSVGQWNRLFVASMGVWALTTMLHAATRLAAVGLVFALTQLRVEPDASRPATARVRRRFGSGARSPSR